jgi:ABC-type sugar transport system permease subunit
VLGLFMAFLLAFLLDAGVRRRQVLAVTAWAFLPVAFERIVTGIFRALRVNPDANPFNPFASNLGFFFDSTRMRPFWYEVACGTDAFLIASIFLAGLALAALSKKPAAALVAALVAGCALGILVRAALLT